MYLAWERTLDNRRYKCNRAANSIALNPPHLLQKIVLKILKCREFRENESEREGAGFRVYADAKNDGIIVKKVARGNTIGMFGASSQQRSQAVRMVAMLSHDRAPFRPTSHVSSNRTATSASKIGSTRLRSPK
jgi:hypothetical protein